MAPAAVKTSTMAAAMTAAAVAPATVTTTAMSAATAGKNGVRWQSQSGRQKEC